MVISTKVRNDFLKSRGVIDLLKHHSKFFTSPIHGIYHWRTVERNGHYLAQYTGADTKVISYFAHFHDCMRENENIDPKHGHRGALFAEEHKSRLGLSDSQFDMLMRACKGHTHGRRTSYATVATCWDADRLDIGRVGITPDSSYLFCDEAKRIADHHDFMVLESYRKVLIDGSYHGL